jgi:predicted nucleotidyltransferase
MEFYYHEALFEIVNRSENKDRIYTLREIKSLIAPIAKGRGVKWLTLIGSYSREQAYPRDDIDIVIWDRGTLLSICEFQLLLIEMFGKFVDIHAAYEFFGDRYKYIKGEEIILYKEKHNKGEEQRIYRGISERTKQSEVSRGAII